MFTRSDQRHLVAIWAFRRRHTPPWFSIPDDPGRGCRAFHSCSFPSFTSFVSLLSLLISSVYHDVFPSDRFVFVHVSWVVSHASTPSPVLVGPIGMHPSPVLTRPRCGWAGSKPWGRQQEGHRGIERGGDETMLVRGRTPLTLPPWIRLSSEKENPRGHMDEKTLWILPEGNRSF